MIRTLSLIGTGLAMIAVSLFCTPMAAAARVSHLSSATQVSDGRTWHATVRCQLVRISDNNALTYATGNGIVPSPQLAVLSAKQNVQVPPGYYKGHCQTVGVW